MLRSPGLGVTFDMASTPKTDAVDKTLAISASAFLRERSMGVMCFVVAAALSVDA